MDVEEQIEKFRDFFEANYQKQIHTAVRKGMPALVADFSLLAQFDPELSELLLEDPDNLIKAGEMALHNLEVENQLKLRLLGVPNSQTHPIRHIRSGHLNKFIAIEGIVRQASDVRPQVVSTKFECPSCGNPLTILQLDTKFKEPTRCSCGRRGKFRLLAKELVDAQRVVLEEAPETLDGGEQPKRLPVFLREDLVEPSMERRTTPGSKIKVFGQLREVPIFLSSGVQSTRFDLSIEANMVEPIEETFEEVKISKKEEEKLKRMSKDKQIYSRLIKSIAPSIFGHEKIKEALVLQLMSGVRKERMDGTRTRGDMHVLLVGDPGCISGGSQIALFHRGMDKIKNLGKVHGDAINEAVTNIKTDANDNPSETATVFQHYPMQPILKIITESGKQVTCTYNQPFLTETGWVRADELDIKTKIRVASKIPNNVTTFSPTEFSKIETKTNNHKKTKIPQEFTPKLASLCGYLLGDGHVHASGYKTAAYVSEEEMDLMPMITSMFENLFDVKTNVYTRNKNSISTIDDGSGLLRKIVRKQQLNIIEVDSKQVNQCLSFLRRKRVPQAIFKSPKQVVAKFISWLFDADGCAFGNGRGRTSVQLKSKKPNLLRDVQLLLLYFEIHSRIVGDNLCMRRARDIELYAKHIGFNSVKKKANLLEALESVRNRSHGQLRKKPQNWERVVKIVICGEKDVYDLEVPRSKRFIANGIVVHNSAKSTLLTAISKIAPRARYVAGRSASAAGITASVVRDEFTKGWALEAGAIVLANKGTLCLHPDTEVVIDDKVKRIEDLFDSNKAKKIMKANTDIEYHDLKESILSFNRQNRSITNAVTTKVSRKKFKGSLVCISLFSNRVLRVTPEHQLLDGNTMEWKSSETFTIGNALVALSIDAEGQKDYIIEKIISIKKEDYDGYVYDLSVPETHNFVANGVIVHNCLDEMDKMTQEDTSALHEAMEQQTISVSKANIQATLRAEASVIAAANPKLGRFDPYQPIASQIDLPPALINRFDLIFPVRDLPNKEMDQKIARHVLKLQQKPMLLEPEYDRDTMKKYISFAKQHVNPKLTDAAIDAMEEFYVNLRNSGNTTTEDEVKPIPISARQLEALVRLAEASARIRLSKKVTRADATRAIGLLKHCLMQVGFDHETGQIDIDRIATGITATQRNRMGIIREIMIQLEESTGNKTVPIESIIEMATEKNIDEGTTEQVLEKLKKEGQIFEPKTGWVARI